MKTLVRGQESGAGSQKAFTLIELLVVIAIIALLAGLTLTVTAGINRTKMRNLAKGALAQMVTDIEVYKAKTGTYPPSDPGNAALNPLYYELGGTVFTNEGGTDRYKTIDGSARIDASTLPLTFGPAIGGFFNSTRGGGGDEGPKAQNFLKTIKSGLFLEVTNPSNSAALVTVLGAPLDGPIVYRNPNGNRINPWRYNSSTPTNNPKTYDLWIDFLVGGRTNRVNNWSQRADVL
jgi:prepilin-type N-terminal cleavage/methylation domain-containing protein